MEEFFKQGDKEQEQGLDFSPLCDRQNTMVPQSQIGMGGVKNPSHGKKSVRGYPPWVSTDKIFQKI